MHRNTILSGTVILMAAGFITRILGFIFRIYLSGLMGSEGMGLYQLISPIYFLAFAVCASGMQLAISRLAAYENARGQKDHTHHILYAGLLLSLLVCVLLTLLLYNYAEWIASHLLLEERLASPLRIISLALPFSVAASCFKAYFFAHQNMNIPAMDQLIEQLGRIGVIYLLAPSLANGSLIDLCCMAAIGNVAGDAISCLYCAIVYAKDRRPHIPSFRNTLSFTAYIPKLLAISIPLTANRVITQLLSSFENIMLPTALQQYGLSADTALGIYGEFSGMAMPVLFFPCVITNALSSNLLPVVARADATRNKPLIHQTICQSVSYTLLIGFLFTAVLFTCGSSLGILLYHNENVGTYITWLSVLCPFFYLQSTLGGLMNGLGLHQYSFIHNLLGDALRVVGLLLLVPLWGVPAFYAGMTVSLILCVYLNVRKLYKTGGLPFHPLQELTGPFIAAVCSVFITNSFLSSSNISITWLLIRAGGCIIVYVLTLLAVDSNAWNLLHQLHSLVDSHRFQYKKRGYKKLL